MKNNETLVNIFTKDGTNTKEAPNKCDLTQEPPKSLFYRSLVLTFLWINVAGMTIYMMDLSKVCSESREILVLGCKIGSSYGTGSCIVSTPIPIKI